MRISRLRPRPWTKRTAAPGASPAGARPGGAKRRLVLVGHDAHPFGAQLILRAVGRTLVHQCGCEVTWILREGGDLLPDYERLGPVRIVGDRVERARHLAARLRRQGYRSAIANTTATGRLVPLLKAGGLQITSLVHELPGIIDGYGLRDDAAAIASSADRVVFPAPVVAAEFGDRFALPEDKVLIRPQGLYAVLEPSDADRERVRHDLGVPPEARIVLNAGSADVRKGVDAFVATAMLATGRAPHLHFVWVGKPNHAEVPWLRSRLEGDTGAQLTFVPHTREVEPYFSAADVLFLTSREDPFPSVVLEAMQLGLPVVALHGSGGAQELVREHGELVDRDDLEGAIDALSRRSSEPTDDPAREARRRVIRDRFRHDEYCFDLLRTLDPDLLRISVVVPSFNYARYLESRLDTIFEQTYPVFEVIVLDDASTDGSVAELERVRTTSGRTFEIVANERNSGSPFRQWARACQLARGDLIWIAEGDDLSTPTFLERLAAKLLDPDVAFAFTDSAQVDETGARLGSSYKDYYRLAADELMERDFVLDGPSFVRRCLTERNLVLNVSSVLWNRGRLQAALREALGQLIEYRLAGDWLLYAVAALAPGDVAYVADPLNVHRRHRGSVTDSLDKRRHLLEVCRIHEWLASRTRANDGVRRRMHDYELELERQFGLTGPS